MTVFSAELTLSNLNDRPYIHGTSIIKGILDSLNVYYPEAKQFNIRLKKKLIYQPLLTISQIETYDAASIATGFFQNNDIKYYFNIIPTNKKCLDKITVDEAALNTRIYETDTDWRMDLNKADDIHVCLNEISKSSNQILFASLPNIAMDNKKQTWFVGCYFPNLDFLKQDLKVAAVSKKYEMLTPTCMKRFIIINDQYIGDRICIYA